MKRKQESSKFATAVGILIAIGFWGGIGSFIVNKSSASQSVVNSNPALEEVPSYVIDQGVSIGGDDMDAGSTSSLDVDEEQIDEECNPNYDGCLPNDVYDMDCADVGRTVEVLGYDEFRLDRDGDGWGCE